jgi:hypothetical protein
MLQALFGSPLILSSKVGDRRSPERSVPAQRTGGGAASDDTPAHVGEAEGAVGPAEGGGKTEARGEGCHLGARSQPMQGGWHGESLKCPFQKDASDSWSNSHGR